MILQVPIFFPKIQRLNSSGTWPCHSGKKHTKSRCTWSLSWRIRCSLGRNILASLPALSDFLQNSNDCWLVGGWATPLKNISQLGWLFPIYGKIKNVPNHQPVGFMEVAITPSPTLRPPGYPQVQWIVIMFENENIAIFGGTIFRYPFYHIP